MSKTNPIFIISGKSPLSGFGGGYSTFSRNLGKTLTKLGFQVYIVALGDANAQKATDFGTLVTVKATIASFNVTALPGLPWFSYKFSIAIKKIMSEYPNGTKAIIWGIGPWGFAGWILKSFFRYPIVHINNYFTTTKHEWKGSLQAVTLQDYGVFIWLKFLLIYHTVVRFLTLLEYFVLSSSDSIVTNYQSTESILTEQFSIPKNKFIRTPFPIEAYIRISNKKHTTARTVNLPKQYILFLSRHDPRKGVNVLLHAAKILSDKKIMMPVIIAGTGELYEANKRLAKKLKLGPYVRFIGFVQDPTPLMQHATIFCLPTFEEGAGALIINEAMSYKLPIVTTSCDGICEDIENGTSGLLVPMGNTQSLANALESVITSPSLRRKLSQGAFRSFLKLNNQKRIRQDIFGVLHKVINH